MTTDKIPFEEFSITVAYGPIRPEHREMVLSGLDHFGTESMVQSSSFEEGKISLSVDPSIEDDEPLILEAVSATMLEVYGAQGVAWSKIDGEWR